MSEPTDYATRADVRTAIAELEIRLIREMSTRDWRLLGIPLPTLLTIAAISVAVARFA